MPLSLATVGEEYVIKRVAGNDEVKRHLEEMGFVPDGRVTLVQVIGGNVIVNVKNVRVAISRELAQKIYV